MDGMAARLDRRPVRLTPLSPIHIGTGDDLDWTSCVLDKAGKQIVAFDSRRLDLNERDRCKLDALSGKALGDQFDPANFVREAQQFFKGQAEAALRAQCATFAVMPRVLDKLDQLTGKGLFGTDRKVVQMMNIARAAADPRTGRPMIPGSGVKGVLRTSWVDGMLHTSWVDSTKGEPKGKFQDDPFSQIAVEDFVSAAPVRSAIIHARNVSRAEDRENENLALRLEAIVPGEATSFRGAFRRLDRNLGVPGFSLEELLAATQKFHRGHWDEQSPQMRSRADPWWMEAMERLVGKLNDEAILIRIGKLCTAESKTVKNREITVRISRSKTEERLDGTTFWLAGDEGKSKGLPFGWALLEPEHDCGRAQELLAAFKANGPWRCLDLVETAPVGSSRNVAAAVTVLTPGKTIIRDLQTKLGAGHLSEDYLKSAINQAVKLESSAERQAVRTWIEAHYREVVRQAFRHKNFQAFLSKLK
jgi:CRISPR-associated protein Csm5